MQKAPVDRPVTLILQTWMKIKEIADNKLPMAVFTCPQMSFIDINCQNNDTGLSYWIFKGPQPLESWSPALLLDLNFEQLNTTWKLFGLTLSWTIYCLLQNVLGLEEFFCPKFITSWSRFTQMFSQERNYLQLIVEKSILWKKRYDCPRTCFLGTFGTTINCPFQKCFSGPETMFFETCSSRLIFFSFDD